MKVTLDTTVLYQALHSNNGASHQILKLIRLGKIQICISVPVFEEYQDVLLRKKSLEAFELKKKDIIAVLDFIIFVGMPTPIHYLWRPNLRDEKDNIFVELAFSSNSKYLITSNIKDFEIDHELLFDSFSIITPSEFIKLWRKKYE